MARKKGLRRLGEVARRLVPECRNVVSDLVGGLTFAVVSVPKAMADALLATVNPVLGI
jgi:MFS superfamily sulfate permease-like transporter